MCGDGQDHEAGTGPGEKAADVAGKRDAMFAGEIINTTEGRAVVRSALPKSWISPVMVAGRDVMPDVRDVLAAMARFAEGVRASEITDVVNTRHQQLGAWAPP